MIIDINSFVNANIRIFETAEKIKSIVNKKYMPRKDDHRSLGVWFNVTAPVIEKIVDHIKAPLEGTILRCRGEL